MTVRETYGWSRHLSWLVVLLLVLMLGAGDAAAAEPKKFTLMNVVLDGTKIWLPSSLGAVTDSGTGSNQTRPQSVR
jgi:hypothetical protein